MHSLNIYFTGVSQVEVREVPVPAPGPGEVLVEARASLISAGTEGICLRRAFEPGSHWDEWVKYPFAPGYSMVGVVRETGAGVTRFRPGDRVTVRAPHHQFVTFPAASQSIVAVPDDVSDEDAAWFALGLITQVGVRRASHVLGDAVAIIGLGPLGQLVTQYMRLLGARAVIAIDPVESRLELARANGATATLALRADQARDAVFELTDGHGADVVYDITGAAPVFAAALPLVRRLGRLVLLGDTGTPTAQHLTLDVIRRGLTIIGAHVLLVPPESTDFTPWSELEMQRLFFTYLQRGDMRVAPLLTHRFAPTDAPAAYRLLAERPAEAMGVLFDWR
jgi:2-desacetyl-2-hydroxyethyl bacteriochlorophyllide A dehydrogenase